MFSPEIFDGVVCAIGRSLGVDPGDVTPESRIEQDLGFDDESYWQDLLFQVAKHFQLNSLTESKHSKLLEIRASCVTVTNLCELVEQRLSVRPQVA